MSTALSDQHAEWHRIQHVREAEMTKRGEVCNCTCGGSESEDHTVGNGCERRGCTCTWWPITFENTSIQVIRWYSITGAPHIKSAYHIDDTVLSPFAVKFTFYVFDGVEECIGVHVNAHPVRKNGTLSERVVQAPLFIHNHQEWPSWLNDVYMRAQLKMAA